MPLRQRLGQNIYRMGYNRLMSQVGLMSLQEMPCPIGWPLLGTTPSVFLASINSRIHKYVDERHKEMGKVFRDKLGPVDTVVVSDPDIMRSILTKYEGKYPQHMVPDVWRLYNNKHDIKRGLFFMNGEEWLQTRRVMNSLLLKPATDKWIDEPISCAANQFTAFWKSKCSTGEYEPNLEQELYQLSLDVILAVVLGSTYSSHRHKYEELLKKFSVAVHGIFLNSNKMFMLPGKFYEKLKLPSWRGFEKSVTDSLTYGEQLVNKLYNKDNLGDGLISKMVAEDLSQDMITRILVDLIIAAGDTTSFTIQWTLHLLANNGHVVNDFMKTTPLSEDENAYVKNIIRESMRLYPTAAFITRILHSNVNIRGYDVPAGTLVVMSVYTAGRSAEYFSDPLSFQPTRWNKTSSHMGLVMPHASIPFALGARSCIGKKIAMAQMKHVITKIMREFHMKSLNRGGVEDVMQMIIMPKQKIRIAVGTRE